MNTQQNGPFFEVDESHPAWFKKFVRARNKEIADAQRLERLRRLARKHGLRVVRPRGRLHPMAGTFGVVDESDQWVLVKPRVR